MSGVKGREKTLLKAKGKKNGITNCGRGWGGGDGKAGIIKYNNFIKNIR